LIAASPCSTSWRLVIFWLARSCESLDDCYRGEFTSWCALWENRLDPPKRCAGKRKSAEVGRFLQKVPTIVIHGVLPPCLFAPIGRTFPKLRR
jgi:hypothetical protein